MRSGFLVRSEARRLLRSYNLVYNLKIPETRIDEILTECSIGAHVDLEMLLRIVSLCNCIGGGDAASKDVTED